MTVTGDSRRPRAEVTVRVLVVAALAVDAVVHWQLAGAMQLAAPGGIGGGTLFRLQAGLALAAAVLLAVTGRRLAYVLAGLVALSALVPVVLYSLVAVPALGPIPSLHDPTWYPAKTASALAEAAGVLLATVGVRLAGRR